MAKQAESATDATLADAAAEDAPAPRRKRLLLPLLAAVAVVAGGAGGAWYFLSRGAAPGDIAHEPKREAKREARPAGAPPIFVTLQPFVVNLAGDSAQHYLQVGIDLKVADRGAADQIKALMPEIQNGVILLLSSKTVADLSTPQGKNRLRREIRAVINKPLGIDTPLPEAQPAVASDAAAPGAVAQANAAAPAGDAGAGQAGVAAALEDDAEGDEGGVLQVLLTSFVIQ